MKPLSLPIVLALCVWVSAASAQVRASPAGRLRTYGLRAGQQRTAAALLGDGTGTFAPRTDFDLGSMYRGGLAIAQLNPAGHPDLVVTIDDTNGGMGIAVASGNGNGTFNAPTLYAATSATTGPATPFPAEVRIADLNGDGHLDLVFTNAGSGTVGVLYGTGLWDGDSSPFYAPVEFAANDNPPALLLADVNGDGALDAIVGSFNFSGVTVLLNNGADMVAFAGPAAPLIKRGPRQAARAADPHDAPGVFTFTANITALRLRGAPVNAPTGTVTFTDGDTGIGSGPITLTDGSASVTTTLTAPGTHIITAVYSGDDNFVPQTKATFVQTIDTPDSGYVLSANTTSATLFAGQSLPFTITATPNPTSTDTLTFSCPSLPQGISCVFSPTSVILAGEGPETTLLTVTVAPDFVASSDSNSRPTHFLGLARVAVGVFAWFVLGGFRRPLRIKLAAVLALIALAAILASVGCAGTPAANNMSPTGTPEMIRVMATTQGRSNVHQLNLTITIRP